MATSPTRWTECFILSAYTNDTTFECGKKVECEGKCAFLQVPNGPKLALGCSQKDADKTAQVKYAWETETAGNKRGNWSDPMFLENTSQNRVNNPIGL